MNEETKLNIECAKLCFPHAPIITEEQYQNRQYEMIEDEPLIVEGVGVFEPYTDATCNPVTFRPAMDRENLHTVLRWVESAGLHKHVVLHLLSMRRLDCDAEWALMTMHPIDICKAIVTQAKRHLNLEKRS